MKISVITITYNSEKTLRDTIESVLSQTYPDVEYIIVDGRSKDSTCDIVKSYGNRIHQFVSEKDNGLYDALNKGIRMATGEVVGFLHSDDIYASADTLKLIAEAFRRFDVDSVYGDLVYVDQNDTGKIIRFWRSRKFSRARALTGWMPPHPTFYVKKSIYEKYGGFNTTFRIAADYESILRFLVRFQVSTFYIPLILVRMRMGGESNKSLKNVIRKSKEDIRAMHTNGLITFAALFNKNASKFKQFMPPEWINRQI
ncbi:MAG: glycosyltransferase family 2 protein [Bacteroidales bacterium]|nr:glycosyltransferase family 2 protein [Bacteroidales bacterium]HNW73949.1 glycosyltransferase family 2 protein [Bacteroidales bacterium]HPS50221.1 glycosyltransferase family 2 protein [Bacteroidales bacterium]